MSIKTTKVSSFEAEKRKVTLTRTHSMTRRRKSLDSGRYLMVFNLLTPLQGHQLDPRVKLFSIYWSTDHFLSFICQLTMFRKKDPQHPKFPPLGYDPDDRMKITSYMFYILYLGDSPFEIFRT